VRQNSSKPCIDQQGTNGDSFGDESLVASHW
jgi:hypothetical protein